MNRTINTTLRTAVTLATAVLVFQGCSKTKMTFINADDVTVSGSSDPNNLTCIKEHYNQPTTELTKKLDLLFVTDTSGSLDSERRAVANGIGNFISQLPSTADYQVAVALAHGPVSLHYGQLYKSGSEPTVLRSKELSITDIRNYLVSKLTNTRTDNDTDGGEAGLLSLSNALSDTRLAEIRSQHNFFRPDAALAIIFVSDENDICAVYPSGVTRVYDPDKKELPAFDKYCKNQVDAASVYDRLLDVQGVNPLLVSAIVYSDNATLVRSGENEFGYGYSDIVRLANGKMVDMAANNIPAGLADIGKAAAIKMNLRSDYTLSYLNVDVSSIKAEVDNVNT